MGLGASKQAAAGHPSALASSTAGLSPPTEGGILKNRFITEDGVEYECNCQRKAVAKHESAKRESAKDLPPTNGEQQPARSRSTANAPVMSPVESAGEKPVRSRASNDSTSPMEQAAAAQDQQQQQQLLLQSGGAPKRKRKPVVKRKPPTKKSTTTKRRKPASTATKKKKSAVKRKPAVKRKGKPAASSGRR